VTGSEEPAGVVSLRRFFPGSVLAFARGAAILALVAGGAIPGQPRRIAA
jgi:hypothetical protein